MTEELEQKLINEYPNVFNLYNQQIIQCEKPISPIVFGCECGDGWYQLIKTLCDKAEKIHADDGLIIYATQIKEKYGSLRFYWSSYPDEEMFIIKERILGIWPSEYFPHSISYCVLNIGEWLQKQIWRFPFNYIFGSMQLPKWLQTSYKQTHIRDSNNVLIKLIPFRNKDFKEIYTKFENFCDFAEDISYYICEKCGKPGKQNNNNNWIKTLCIECYQINIAGGLKPKMDISHKTE